MDLPSVSTLYRIACQLIISLDPITQQVTKIHTQREESQRRAKFLPMLTAREVMAADPGAKRHTIMKHTEILVATEDREVRLDHARSLTTQGQLHHLVDDDASSLWSEVVQKLPPECMKFALNAAQDTLPPQCQLVPVEERSRPLESVQTL